MKTSVYCAVIGAALLRGTCSGDPHKRKTIEREYAYQTTEQDDQQTAQILASSDMREILLRDAGEFLYPELRSSHNKQAQKVEAVTAGIVGMDILDERWDSTTGRFYILARVVVEPHKVKQRVAEVLNDASKTQELVDSRQRAQEARGKIQTLKAEMALSEAAQPRNDMTEASSDTDGVDKDDWGRKYADANTQPIKEKLIKEEKRAKDDKLAKAEAKQNKASEAYKKEINKLAVEEYFVQGFNAQENGATDKAIDYYQKAIELTPEDALIYIKMGSAYSEKEDYNQAIIYFQKAIDINPYSAYAYNNLGNAYAAIRDYTQALYCFNKAILIDPYEPYAYNNMGNAYSAQKDYVNAIDYYTKAVKADPTFAGAYCNMGTTYADLHDYKQALDCYQKAISLDPGLADAYNNMGYVNYELKNYERAMNNFQKAIQINPSFAEAYTNMGLVAGAQGKTSQQKEYSSKAARLGDDNARKWMSENGYKW